MPPRTVEEQVAQQGEETVSISFSPGDAQKLKQLAGATGFADFIVHAIGVYASMADQAQEGFTQIRARNPSTGEERVYGGAVLPERT